MLSYFCNKYTKFVELRKPIHTMKEFWNDRYAEKEFVYGTLPNKFLQQSINELPQGKVLFAAEGEGRNAVFAAKKGYVVSAFDISESAKNKAEALAQEQQVTIDYLVGDVFDLGYAKQTFDGLVLIFAHFPAAERTAIHAHLLSLLKPGGVIIFEAFSKEQLNYSSGGPKEAEMLFSLEEIQKNFPGVAFKFIGQSIIHLDEGPYHQGEGSVIRFVARKN